MIRFPSEAPTPVGALCASCDEPIAAGDWGEYIPLLGPDTTVEQPHHGECMVRAVMGGIEHLTAPDGHPVGSCYEGSTLTYRQSAIAAYRWLQEHKPPEPAPS